MKKNTLFRVVNGIGFAANAASVCLPRDSLPQLAFKAVSFGCNVLSYGMQLRALTRNNQNWKASLAENMPMLVMTGLVTCGDGLNALPLIDNTVGLQSLAFDLGSGCVQVMNMRNGLTLPTPEKRAVNGLKP